MEGEVRDIALPAVTADLAAADRTVTAFTGLVDSRLEALESREVKDLQLPGVTTDLEETQHQLDVFSGRIAESFDSLGEEATQVSRTLIGVGEGRGFAAVGPPTIVPMGALGAQDRRRDAARSLVIQGPLVNIEGSADRRTAEYAAGLVVEKLKSVVRETTSSGSNVKTERIRLPSLGDPFAGRR
jgi:hypothetical protein